MVSFKIFSLSLIFWSVNMTCLGVDFWCLYCLIFSELSGSVVWWLSLVLKDSVIIDSHLFLFFLSSPSGIPIAHMLHLFVCVCPQFLHILFCHFYFYFYYFFSLHFTLIFTLFYWLIFKLTNSFLDCIQSIWWVHQMHSLFWLQCFLFLIFTFDSFLDFPSLCLPYLSVLAHCSLSPLESLVH